MSKVRINDLARELEVKSKAILDTLPIVGVTEKKTHSSSLEEHEAEKVRVYLRGSSEAQSPSARAARPLRGEEEIKALGFRQFRVRFHGELVRIEIAKEELPKALTLEMAANFTAIFKPLGFHYVTIDLEGYRQGSLNSVLQH